MPSVKRQVEGSRLSCSSVKCSQLASAKDLASQRGAARGPCTGSKGGEDKVVEYPQTPGKWLIFPLYLGREIFLMLPSFANTTIYTSYTSFAAVVCVVLGKSHAPPQIAGGYLVGTSRHQVQWLML